MMLIVQAKVNAQVEGNDSDAKTVTILAVNDMHAAIDMFSKFAAVVDSIRGVHPDLLLFSAGDNRTGNPANDRYEMPGFPMVDRDSPANFFCQSMGMNIQGTMTSSVSMYANRYPWKEALKFFGAIQGYGAQAIKN